MSKTKAAKPSLKPKGVKLLDSIRVVLYLRRSDEKREGGHIEDQRKACLAYAKKHGYAVVGEFVDDGISGDDTKKRLDFLRDRKQVDSGKFDAVLCWDQERVSDGSIHLKRATGFTRFVKRAWKLITTSDGTINWDDFTGRTDVRPQARGKAPILTRPEPQRASRPDRSGQARLFGLAACLTATSLPAPESRNALSLATLARSRFWNASSRNTSTTVGRSGGICTSPECRQDRKPRRSSMAIRHGEGDLGEPRLHGHLPI